MDRFPFSFPVFKDGSKPADPGLFFLAFGQSHLPGSFAPGGATHHFHRNRIKGEAGYLIIFEKILPVFFDLGPAGKLIEIPQRKKSKIILMSIIIIQKLDILAAHGFGVILD